MFAAVVEVVVLAVELNNKGPLFLTTDIVSGSMPSPSNAAQPPRFSPVVSHHFLRRLFAVIAVPCIWYKEQKRFMQQIQTFL
ncbi:hypothetical protein PIB30_008545 [Stylosanthes scabra]|uniref:Secreted protein n=1 Tax=Stylosanthes scabra TaxID=79078 RepID=A0ABU6Z221_9FABA|nr:hypothetical protein [Stylosanthes scabra]